MFNDIVTFTKQNYKRQHNKIMQQLYYVISVFMSFVIKGLKPLLAKFVCLLERVD